MKRGSCGLLFIQVIHWVADGWIIGHFCFYHLPLWEWMKYYKFKGEKWAQRPSLWFLVLKLSSSTIVAWVELILWTSVLAYIVWIESHLLDFTYAFSLIWQISHVSIVASLMTKYPSKLSLLNYKIVVTKNLIQYHQDRKKAMSRPSKRKNQPESIDNHVGHLSDYQMMRKQCADCAMEGKKNRTFFICFCLYRFIMLSKVKRLLSKASQLGVHITYTLYNFAKMLWFFVWFLSISTVSLSFFYR